VSDFFDSRRVLLDEHLAAIGRRAVAPHPLREVLTSALASRGKRVRGLLLLATGAACGTPAGKLLDSAAAIEMIHTSSLILDDLPSMDNAELRRGQRTLHTVFGEDLAILTSVTLLNHSYALVARNHEIARPRRWSLQQLIQRLVDAVGWNGTIGGQSVDLHSEASALDFPTLEFIHSRKTGALFVGAAAIGGMLANTNEATLCRFEVFAKNLGLAFQITDDVLDVTSDSEQLGKDVGKDAERLTFVKLAGLDGARKLAEELVETSIASISSLGSAAQPLRDLAVTVRDRVR
jgi:geranylgeranyl diphosphate synthase type II